MKLLPAILFTAASLLTALTITLIHEHRADARARIMAPCALPLNSR